MFRWIFLAVAAALPHLFTIQIHPASPSKPAAKGGDPKPDNKPTKSPDGNDDDIIPLESSDEGEEYSYNEEMYMTNNSWGPVTRPPCAKGSEEEQRQERERRWQKEEEDRCLRAALRQKLDRAREAKERRRGTVLRLEQEAAAAARAQEAEYARERQERERRWQTEDEDRRLRAALRQKLDRAREAKERSRGTVLRLKQEAAAASSRAREAEYARRFEAPDDKPTKSDTISDGSDDAKPFAVDEARDNDVGAEKVAALQRELRSEREGRRKAEMEVLRLREEIERIQAEREVNGTPQPRRSPRRIGAKGKGMK